MVPIFVFNENNAFDQFDTEHPFVLRLKKRFQKMFGISLPLLCNVFPKQTEMTIVFGNPISIKPGDDSSNEDNINKYLELYIQELKNIYRTYGKIYNIPPTKPELEVI
jgi:Diacylglycerol acyltransferase